MLNKILLPIGSLIEEKQGEQWKIVPVDIAILSDLNSNPEKYRYAKITHSSFKRFYGWDKEPLMGRNRWQKERFSIIQKWNDDSFWVSFDSTVLKRVQYHHELHLIIISLDQ